MKCLPLSILLMLVSNSGVALAGDMVKECVDSVNYMRYSNGQGQLFYSDSMMRAAFYHARDMAERGYFSHYTPEGWSIQMRVQGQGYPNWLPVGENIGSAGDAWSVVNIWMSEPGHRNLILWGGAKDIGCAHYYKAGSPFGNYWVLVIGGSR